MSNKFISSALEQDADIRNKKEESGCIEIINPAKVFIDNRDTNNGDNVYRSCLALRMKNNNATITKIFAQYLKSCTEKIIKKYVKDGKLTKNILFLHRNNNFSFRVSTEDFLNVLKIAASKKLGISREELDNKLQIMSMHKSKGLGKEVVVILEADDGIIPLYHQDACLYEIFGENEKVIYEDQVRLFYVAITRAEEDLYIFHTDNEEIAKDEDDEEDNYLFANKQKSFWKCVQDSLPGASEEDDSIFYW